MRTRLLVASPRGPTGEQRGGDQQRNGSDDLAEHHEWEVPLLT